MRLTTWTNLVYVVAVGSTVNTLWIGLDRHLCSYHLCTIWPCIRIRVTPPVTYVGNGLSICIFRVGDESKYKSFHPEWKMQAFHSGISPCENTSAKIAIAWKIREILLWELGINASGIYFMCFVCVCVGQFSFCYVSVKSGRAFPHKSYIARYTLQLQDSAISLSRQPFRLWLTPTHNSETLCKILQWLLEYSNSYKSFQIFQLEFCVCNVKRSAIMWMNDR